MPKTKDTSLIPSGRIENKILFLRGEKVILDLHLADLYEVPTKALNQAVKRNKERFPGDFMFQLTKEEMELYRSQTVTGSQKHRDPRARPYAFTDFGIAMLSSVLKSDRAIHVNIEIMRTFIRIRRLVASNKELREALEAMDRKYGREIRGVREDIKRIYTVIAQLVAVDETPKLEMGFQAPKRKKPRR